MTIKIIMHILILGGTGFIGSKLAQHFIAQGCEVTVFTRSIHHPPFLNKIHFINELNSPDARYDVVINLAGEPLNKNRWTKDVKKTIYDSRILSTQKIVEYMGRLTVKPKVFINASAIGFYGHSASTVFNENSKPENQGFTHTLCHDWEMEAIKAEKLGIRVCRIRLGIVLDQHHGALAEMIMPFKFGLGAQIGEGQQWMAWIHYHDVVGAIDFMVHNEAMEGAINVTAAEPVSNETFTKVLAKSLNRPAFFKLPAFMVKIIFGEMGETLLLCGQHVVPQKITSAGYIFKFPKLKDALSNIFQHA